MIRVKGLLGRKIRRYPVPIRPSLLVGAMHMKSPQLHAAFSGDTGPAGETSDNVSGPSRIEYLRRRSNSQARTVIGTNIGPILKN